MAVIIPNVTNWSVTPQNGQEDYFTKMNVWLSESTNVIASLSTAITKINESNAESNDNLEEVLTARDEAVAARNEAVTAIATLTAGAIDDTTIASNKAFSNQFITNNYYKKTETYNKTEVDTAISDATLDINTLPDKPTPVNTDNLVLQEVGGGLKKLSWLNLKNTIFNGAVSLTTNGYIKFPSVMGGLILQWGKNNSGVQSVTFPLTFPTTCLNVIATMHGSSAAQPINEQETRNYTTTGFEYVNYAWAKNWIAIGH